MNIKVFAKGYNPYKLFWIFLSCSFIGAMVEMVWCYFTMGKLMSRSSLVYGQFSIIWGLGTVLLTVILHRMEGKRDLSIFMVGTIAGGIYEYACSLVGEYMFGVRFWDYSDIAFNIDGRVNLLFCFFWGLIAVVWVQNIYPFLSAHIEKIPLKAGKLLTYLFAIFLCYDMALSALALGRSYQRQMNIPAQNQVAEYLDENFDDQFILKRYQNILPR